MYFPYLRGRQFELIALRELLEKQKLSKSVIPIIEPVKLSSTLVKTLATFSKANCEIALLHNPQVGTFLSDLSEEKNQKIKEELLDQLKNSKVICGYFVNQYTPTHMDRLLKKGKTINDIMAICCERDSIAIYQGVFSHITPRFTLIPDKTVFRKKIINNIVLLDDHFVKQSRNADYEDDEAFSEDHLYCYDDGYTGFSDYSIVGVEYSESGFAPYAVAIHIVYFDDDDSLRIRHFVSDSNDDITDPARKFAEAVEKLVKWNLIQQLDTIGIKTFEALYRDEKYPGLGTIKKLSIMHHIELMGSYLHGRE